MSKTKIGILSVLALAACGLQACGPARPAGPPPLSPAQACLQTTDPALGLDICKTAIAASPDDSALRLRMALLRLKSHSLAAARQAYQSVLSATPNSAEAQFGLGLTLEAVGEDKANLKKLEAAKLDPTVVDRFRKYGIAEPDLMLFDTAPLIVGGQSPEKDKAMEPKQPLAQGVSVDVRCLVALTSKLHDCVVTSPLKPDQAAYGEAAKTILAQVIVRPAKNMGAPVADAPINQTYVFWPRT